MVQHVIQSDPVIIVFLLTVHDITVGELHTVTTGTLGFDVVIDVHNIEATNVNAVLVGFVTRLARLTPNISFWFVTHSLLTKATGGLGTGRATAVRVVTDSVNNRRDRIGGYVNRSNTFGW